MESKERSMSVGPRHEGRGRDKRILQAALVSTGPTGLCNSPSHPSSGGGTNDSCSHSQGKSSRVCLGRGPLPETLDTV